MGRLGRLTSWVGIVTVLLGLASSMPIRGAVAPGSPGEGPPRPAEAEGSAPTRAEAPVERLPRHGPLPLEDVFGLSIGFLRLSPAAQWTLEPGGWEISAVTVVGNDFAQSGVVEELLGERSFRDSIDVETLRALEPPLGASGLFRLDLEHYITTLGVARQFGSGNRLELSVPIVDLEGGFFDRTIEGFHDLFSLNQAGRTGVPRRQVAFYLRSDDREVVLNEETGKTLGDVRLALTHEVGRHPRTGTVFSLRGVLKLPTGSVESLASSGSLDLGLQVLARRTLDRAHAYASVGGVYLGRHDLLGLDEQWVFSVLAGWERPLKKRASFLAQLSLATSPYSDLGLPELDQVLIEATLGVRYPFRRGQIFFGFTENIANFNNSSDIGLSFGISHALSRSKR